MAAERGAHMAGGDAAAWARRATRYDVFEGSDLRRGPAKRALFARMQGETLFIGIGTGLDIAHFPRGLAITAIDISDAMLERARRRHLRDRPPGADEPAGPLRFVRADAAALPYADSAFATVATSCTLCSVADPAGVLREVSRVLRPGGRLLLFEHVRSAHPVLATVLDVMSWWTRRGGTDMSRDTLGAVRDAGFVIRHVEPAFLDIILAVHAEKPRAGGPGDTWSGAPSRPSERPAPPHE